MGEGSPEEGVSTSLTQVNGQGWGTGDWTKGEIGRYGNKSHGERKVLW